MRAIVKTRPAPGASLLDVPEARITANDQVLVQMEACSICGTDYHVYRWDEWSAGRVRPPRIMGHELAGRVIEVGADVHHMRPGDRVSAESHWVCGQCFQCRNGQRHVCRHTRIMGVDADGCFSDLVVLPSASVWVNDPSVPPEVACVQDPLGNAVHAVLVDEIVGRTVAVLGCGPIGLFAVAVARSCGAVRIVATDSRPFRLDLARRLGADDAIDITACNPVTVVRDMTSGLGVDVVLEMSGAPVAVRQAMEMVRAGGRVSLMGIPSREVGLDVGSMIFKGLTVHCVVGRRLYETWDTMRSMLSAGHLDVAAAITHQIPFEEYEEGMALMREGLCGKVVFRP
ncbi:MAG TPA: L-threonine 3-dehydrogenase [Chthonomonadales bacterium]|nr:L-threonine 3-dehydrogenase [Chthonomonadales bacterium]